MKQFQEGEFVKEGPRGQPRLITKVERRASRHDMDRFTLQAVDGTTYSNIPAYVLCDATEEEVKKALGL